MVTGVDEEPVDGDGRLEPGSDGATEDRAEVADGDAVASDRAPVDHGVECAGVED
jgi:hypothetical protein